MRKPIIIHLFFLIIAGLIYFLGIKGPDLTWNMILALIAYDFALATSKLTKRLFVYLSAILWLAFFPNTFYMLTDIIHMVWVGGTLWDQHIMVQYMAFVFSILFGVLCGIESWLLIRRHFRLSWKQVYLIVPILSGISAMAISIGRYERFNSWNLVTNPLAVVHTIIDTVSWQRFPFVLGFTFIQILCLIFLDPTEDTPTRRH